METALGGSLQKVVTITKISTKSDRTMPESSKIFFLAAAFSTPCFIAVKSPEMLS